MPNKIEKIIREEVQRQVMLRELFQNSFDFWLKKGKYPNENSEFPKEGDLTYRFNTPNSNYHVLIKYHLYEEKKKSYIILDFETEEEGWEGLTHEGIPSQVLKTVFEILKEVLKNLPPVEKIKTSVADENKEESRFSFYKKAVPRLFPGAKIKVTKKLWDVMKFEIILPKNYKERL